MITMACNVNQPVITKSTYENRLQCIEHYTNCMVGEGGNIRKERWPKCKQQWDEGK